MMLWQAPALTRTSPLSATLQRHGQAGRDALICIPASEAFSGRFERVVFYGDRSASYAGAVSVTRPLYPAARSAAGVDGARPADHPFFRRYSFRIRPFRDPRYGADARGAIQGAGARSAHGTAADCGRSKGMGAAPFALRPAWRAFRGCAGASPARCTDRNGTSLYQSLRSVTLCVCFTHAVDYGRAPRFGRSAGLTLSGRLRHGHE